MKVKRYVFPHNDLLNLAFHHLEIIKKNKKSEEPGKKLDCLACIIAIAFASEAIINFVGFMRVNKWNEKLNSEDKINLMFETYLSDKDKELQKCLHELRIMRNCVAHSKPILEELEVKGEGKGPISLDLTTLWDDRLTLEYCEHVYGAVKRTQKLLFERVGIDVAESVTHGSWESSD